MSKKLIITISIVAVLLGVLVFGAVLVRTRILSDAEVATEPPSVVTETEQGTAALPTDSEASSVLAPPSLCGDGMCSEGEKNCSIDCGSGEAYFRASVRTRTLTDTSVKVMWKTREESIGTVRYGITPEASDGSVETSAPGTEHAVTVTGLTRGSQYYFGISVSEGGESYEYGSFLHEGF